jgi:iron complex transport system ATP-binding protein
MRLAVENLSVELSGRKILQSVSFAVEPRQVVGLLGPNGAGKSTLMRALAGQVEFTGTARLDDQDISQLDAAARARLAAYIPQNRVIGWGLSVADVVGLARLPWRGFAKGFGEHDRAACRRAMELMEILDLAQRPATELSGGEQARVLAARAVAQETPLLIADEPASGLDPAHQMTMMRAIRALAGEGRAILVSLHDLTLAARWCDRILMLKEGRLVADGKPEEVMTAERLREVYGVTAHIARDSCGLILAPTGLIDRE